MDAINYRLFVPCLSFPLFGGFLSSLGNRKAVRTWYKTLNKPRFNLIWAFNLFSFSYVPPNIILPIVWVSLYFAMGIAHYQILLRSREIAPHFLYGLQLLVNFSFCPLFFKLKRFRMAFWSCSVLTALSACTAISWYSIYSPSAAVMAVSCGWALFTSIISRYILVHNSDADSSRANVPTPKKF